MEENQGRTTPHSDQLLLQQFYWLNRLSGSLPEQILLTHDPRPLKHSRVSRSARFTLPGELSEKISKLAKNSPLSIYLVLVSALTILLHKYTGNDELLVGSPAYEAEPGPEPVNNMVALRFSFDGRLSFKEHLLAVKKTVREAYQNQDYPFQALVESLNLPREAGRQPIFDIVVWLKNIHDGNQVKDLASDLCFGFAADGGGGLSLEVEYDEALYGKATVEAIAAHYQQILKHALQDLNVKIEEVKMLSPEEERRLLFEFNDTGRPGATARLTHEVFEEQVERTPDAIAAVHAGRSLTYAELNAGANRLAHQLTAAGVGPEVLVSVLARRGLDLLITILALFKSGGAYLPLDPLHPPARLAKVIGQSRCAFVLAADEFREVVARALAEVPAAERPAVLGLEEMLGRAGSEENPPPRCAPNSLAYVIYTSGSTGQPKGAMVEHAGMRNHLYAKVLDLGLTEDDVVAETASQCFDVSVWQFLVALLVGGKTYVADDETARDALAQLETVARERVTVLEIVPSQLRVMLEREQARGRDLLDLSGLRWLVVNGEALPPELCRQWYAIYPEVRLLNAYGPTECSDDVTHYVFDGPPPKEMTNVPIGRPLANLRMYVLDRTLSPVPVGIPGELYVGGVGVGRGYLNDPARTAVSYVPNRFSVGPGERLYRTGDLARFLPDGNLEFLGRIDHQVKVRGFRIELGEIEAALGLYSRVRECVVAAREDEPGEKRLVAYLVLDSKDELATSTLRGYLAERLPEYMIPSAFVTLGSLPLNSNGKLDRRALPLPDYGKQEAGGNFVAPRTPTEETLAGIWRRTLGVEQIGIHDNFFELGGHSLLATQVMSRLRDAFHVELPLQRIFEAPTIAELSLSVSEKQLEQESDEELADMLAEIRLDSNRSLEAALAEGNGARHFLNEKSS